MGIWFFDENTRYVVRGKTKIRKWIVDTVTHEGAIPGDINIILCKDEFLAELNLKYLRHKSLTDIITFPFDDGTGRTGGDIYISLPRVRENAGKYGQTTVRELNRVIIHGVLHLTGQNDKTPQEKEEMTLKEDRYLSLLGS